MDEKIGETHLALLVIHTHTHLVATSTASWLALQVLRIHSKNHAPEGFIPFELRLIFFFFEILK